ncbi:MAG TPA: glycosyltransferase family 39 protein [Acetobacteraceae bacterium]|nr:glycosyltransferase family 39 protein [Acetobacteraceae bacterium]
MGQTSALRAPVARSIADRALAWRLLALLAIAAFYLLLPNNRPDFSPYDAEDAEVYVGLSWALTHGLGYTRSLIPGQFVPHTTFPPGMALLLAPATMFTGLPLPWWLVKLPIIATALLGVLFAWFYVRRITGRTGAADAAALLLASNPYYWDFGHLALSEVPTTVWAIGGVLMVDLIWAERRPRLWQAGLAGFVAGFGMLVKGSLLGLALAPLGFLVERRGTRLDRAGQIRAWLVYAAAFVTWFLAWMLRNRGIHADLGFDGINQIRMLFAHDPVNPASPLMTPVEVARNALDSLMHRIIYRVPQELLPWLWTRALERLPAAFLVAAVLTAVIALLAVPVRRVGVPLFLVIAPMAALLVLYAWGAGTRFWVPVTLLTLLLLVARLYPWVAAWKRPARSLFAAALAIVCATSLLAYVVRFERHPLAAGSDDLLALFARIRAMPDPPPALLTYHATAYTLITGLPAPLTVPGIGLLPRYTHLISRAGHPVYPPSEAPPRGAALLSAIGPWQLYALPRPMTLAAIRDGDARSGSHPIGAAQGGAVRGGIGAAP